MPTNILMPALSPTMTEGTLARWLKKEGDKITAGDVIAEIETDKATMEVEAVDEGVLGKILVADGTAGVKVNDPIAILEDGKAASTPAPKPAAAPGAPAPKPVEAKAPEPAAAHTNGHAEAERIFASPLAKRVAKQAGIDLSGIKGSGPNGRIVVADVTAKPVVVEATPVAAPAPAAPVAKAPSPAPASAITAPGKLVPLNAVKRVTARRLTEAKQTVPHFYVSIDIAIDALLKLRSELNSRSPKDGAGSFKLSVNDMIIKACATTLRRVPMVNASFTEKGMFIYDDVDISVAVSIPGGLITPIIRNADKKSVVQISNEAKLLIDRAKSGKLQPEEYQGGSFSISNMGMFGVTDFAAIINPPQAAILAVAAGEQRPVVKDGALAIATMLTVTLSVDHRAIDGALAAEFVSTLKGVIEDPLSLLL